jgi:glycosyltransferase involved in cell wall biosynthesis
MMQRASANPCRVLELSERSPDRYALGGLEVHVADLQAHLGSGVEPFGAHSRSKRLVVEAFRPARRDLALLAGDLAGALSTALLALDVDVLHVHSPKLGPSALARALDQSGARAVLTLHDTAFAGPDLAPLATRADVVIAPSRFIAELFTHRFPSVADKIRIVRWGVPEQQRAAGQDRGNLRVAVVGVLATSKGSAHLPELMRACAQLGIEWHLFGATEGRELRAIRRAAPDLRAHGSYRREDLGRLLHQAGIDVAVLPSITPESFCMTLSECSAAAVPVVASDRGALGERVRDEQCGWIFDPGRPASLAAVLERLVDRSEIAAVKRRLEARTVHTAADMAAEHEQIYVELAGRGRRQGVDDARRGEALRLFHASRCRGQGRLRAAWRALRRSKPYRDLGLRRALPETLRGVIERRAGELLDRWKR